MEGILNLAVRALCTAIFFPAGAGVRTAVGFMLLTLSLPFAQEVGHCSVVLNCLIGMVLGSFIVFVKEFGRMLGAFLDTGRGQSLGSVHNPTTLTMDSPLASYLGEIVWLYAVLEGILPLIVSVHIAGLKMFPLDVLDMSSVVALERLQLEIIMTVVAEAMRVLLVFASFYLFVDIAICLVGGVVKLGIGSNEIIIIRSCVTFLFLFVALQSGYGFALDRMFALIGGMYSVQ